VVETSASLREVRRRRSSQSEHHDGRSGVKPGYHLTSADCLKLERPTATLCFLWNRLLLDLKCCFVLPKTWAAFYGHDEFLGTLADPQHEQQAEYLEWIGDIDPKSFDARQATSAMKQGLPDWRPSSNPHDQSF
jgi:hypothetical protein